MKRQNYRQDIFATFITKVNKYVLSQFYIKLGLTEKRIKQHFMYFDKIFLLFDTCLEILFRCFGMYVDTRQLQPRVVHIIEFW